MVTQGGSEGVSLIMLKADVIHSESVSISGHPGHLPDTNDSTACCISTVHHNWNLLTAAWKRGNPESPCIRLQKTTGQPDLMCLARSGGLQPERSRPSLASANPPLINILLSADKTSFRHPPFRLSFILPDKYVSNNLPKPS